MSKIKCEIEKYDISKTEPPYKTIHVGEFEIDSSDDDSKLGTGGVGLYKALCAGCARLGYRLKFYTMPENSQYKYSVNVALNQEEWPHCSIGDFGCYCKR